LEPSQLALFAVVGAISTWRNRRQREREIAFWSVVWQLRQASAGDRARMLAELEPEHLRTKVEAILSHDGSNEAVGDVEQFPYPLGLRRLANRAYWFMWALAVSMLITAAAIPAPVWLRCIPLVVAGCGAYAAWSASQRERSFASVIEVTPFRVSELFPDGRVRTVLFSWYLELHHEAQHQRLRLTPKRDEPGIILDCRRMGFDRLVELVVRYGDFRPVPSDSSASST
jgi:hypothetical protein